MNLTALPDSSGGMDSPKESFRAWYGMRPIAGSMYSLRIFSGVRAATVSISIPPSVDAIMTTRDTARSMTMPRYSSFLIAPACSTRTRFTFFPCGPVWWVTRVIPMTCFAYSLASSGVLASLMPPPFPRPPAWIWALMTTGVPNSLAMSSASDGTSATFPLGTATPYLARTAFA